MSNFHQQSGRPPKTQLRQPGYLHGQPGNAREGAYAVGNLESGGPGGYLAHNDVGQVDFFQRTGGPTQAEAFNLQPGRTNYGGYTPPAPPVVVVRSGPSGYAIQGQQSNVPLDFGSRDYARRATNFYGSRRHGPY